MTVRTLTLDLHAAVQHLRVRYGRTRTALARVDAEPVYLAALDGMERLLETSSPTALSLEPIQGAVAAILLLCAQRHRAIMADFAQAIWVYLAQLEVNTKGALSEALYELS